MKTNSVFETAVKRYNSIMEHIGYEHLTIGTSYSEETDDWNLRDMVAEMDYVYSTYFENGHCNGDMRHRPCVLDLAVPMIIDARHVKPPSFD